MRRKRLRSLVLVGLGLVAFGLVALAWSMWTYAELVRLQVRLADAGARVDAAGGVRLGLVTNLLQDARDFPVPDSLERLAHARLAAVAGGALLPFDADSRGAFQDAHRELTAALEEFWVRSADLRESAARRIVGQLRPELERASRELERSLARLDRDLGVYGVTVRRFPGNLVAGIAELDGDVATAVDDTVVDGAPMSPSGQTR